MRLGIFAKTFPGSNPETVLRAASQAGFACVQYNMACSGLPAMPDDIQPAAAEAIARASLHTGIEIAAVSGTYNMIHPDRFVREQGHRRLDMLASRAKAMGTRLITLCTGTRDAQDQWKHHPDNASKEAWRDLLDSMTIALEIAARHDVDLGIEPELANVVNSAARAEQLIKEMQSPRLKIVLDAANLFEQVDIGEQRRIVSSAINGLGPYIAMAHAKDRDAGGSFVTAGKGVLDYSHYVSCLNAAGFDGPLVTHGLAAEEAAGVAGFLRQALSQQPA